MITKTRSNIYHTVKGSDHKEQVQYMPYTVKDYLSQRPDPIHVYTILSKSINAKKQAKYIPECLGQWSQKGSTICMEHTVKASDHKKGPVHTILWRPLITKNKSSIHHNVNTSSLKKTSPIYVPYYQGQWSQRPDPINTILSRSVVKKNRSNIYHTVKAIDHKGQVKFMNRSSQAISFQPVVTKNSCILYHAVKACIKKRTCSADSKLSEASSHKEQVQPYHACTASLRKNRSTLFHVI